MVRPLIRNSEILRDLSKRTKLQIQTLRANADGSIVVHNQCLSVLSVHHKSVSQSVSQHIYYITLIPVLNTIAAANVLHIYYIHRVFAVLWTFTSQGGCNCNGLHTLRSQDATLPLQLLYCNRLPLSLSFLFVVVNSVRSIDRADTSVFIFFAVGLRVGFLGPARFCCPNCCNTTPRGTSTHELLHGLEELLDGLFLSKRKNNSC